MVLFIPVFILILFGIAIQVLGRTRFNIVQTWVFAIIGAALAWLSFIFVKILGSGLWVASYFKTGTSIEFQTILHIEEKNWVYGFLLLTLLIATLFLDSSRLTGKFNLLAWSGAMLISASGLLAIMSGSVIAFLLTSAMVDIILFASQIIIQKGSSEVRKIIFDFLSRLIGAFLIMFAFGVDGDLGSLLFTAGMVLRLGLVSIGPEIPQTITIRQNLAVLFDMVVPLSVFAFMTEMPFSQGAYQGKSVLLAIVIILCISNALKIIKNQNTRPGNHAWIKAVSGLAILLFIQGHVDSIQPLSIVFCVLGGLHSFEFSVKSKSRVAIILLMLSMIGVPLSPSYGIWLTPIQESSTFFLFFYNLILAFLILSVFYSVIFINAKIDQKDHWVEISSVTSPIILLSAPWILEIWIRPVKTEELNFLSSGIFLAFLSLLIFFKRNEKVENIVKKNLNMNNRNLINILSMADRFLNFDWISKILTGFNQVLSNLIKFFERVLEGDGGLLWAFVFLILISSILLTYRLIS